MWRPEPCLVFPPVWHWSIVSITGYAIITVILGTLPGRQGTSPPKAFIALSQSSRNQSKLSMYWNSACGYHKSSPSLSHIGLTVLIMCLPLIPEISEFNELMCIQFNYDSTDLNQHPWTALLFRGQWHLEHIFLITSSLTSWLLESQILDPLKPQLRKLTLSSHPA